MVFIYGKALLLVNSYTILFNKLIYENRTDYIYEDCRRGR